MEKYIEYWNTGEFKNIEEILHPDFELRMTPEFNPETGIENFKNAVLKWRAAYPDFHISVNEYVFDKNKIAALWTISATNTRRHKDYSMILKINVNIKVTKFAEFFH